MRRVTLSLVAIIILLTGVFTWTQIVEAPSKSSTSSSTAGTTRGLQQTIVSLGDASVTADIADTEVLRERGLSGRSSLTDGEGMLFVFQTEGSYGFWMKDMLIPIDMIWLSKDKRVVYIKQNAEPDSYPASFGPMGNALYVLEVPAGWASQHGVILGSMASF